MEVVNHNRAVVGGSQVSVFKVLRNNCQMDVTLGAKCILPIHK
jgi:hypothetical protein